MQVKRSVKASPKESFVTFFKGLQITEAVKVYSVAYFQHTLCMKMSALSYKSDTVLDNIKKPSNNKAVKETTFWC
jgi:hypothetical protein